jgi:hypothetical protein
LSEPASESMSLRPREAALRPREAPTERSEGVR